jgi:hypothetical protein
MRPPTLRPTPAGAAQGEPAAHTIPMAVLLDAMPGGRLAGEEGHGHARARCNDAGVWPVPLHSLDGAVAAARPEERLPDPSPVLLLDQPSPSRRRASVCRRSRTTIFSLGMAPGQATASRSGWAESTRLSPAVRGARRAISGVQVTRGTHLRVRAALAGRPTRRSLLRFPIRDSVRRPA